MSIHIHAEPPEANPPHSFPDSEPPAWGWREVGAVMLMVVMGTMMIMGALQLIVAVTGQELDTAGMASPAVYGAGMLIYALLIGGIYLFVARRTGWQALGWRAVPWHVLAITTPLLLVLALAGMILINLLMLVVSGAFENPQVDALTGGQALSMIELLLLFSLVAVVVPIAEELFFRGLIYPLLRHHWGAVGGIITNALIFAVFHVFPQLIPGLFFVGLILAFLRERSNSVIPGIVLHAGQNAIALYSINAALSAP